VDNRVASFALHFSNGIPIKDYEGDKNDRVLMTLSAYLQSFMSISDIRQKIKADFKLEKYITDRTKLH
jgi:hypothetical protein